MSPTDGARPTVSANVVLRVVVGQREPITGAIIVEGGECETAFVGWIELMAAVNAARGQVDRPAGSAPPP